MNLNFIDKEFKRLETVEGFIDYEFEPKCQTKQGKRNIYYDDLKLDFVDEVNTFGFSPFILENFERQRKNPHIMQYMNKKFNHGLTNYVRMRNKDPRSKLKQYIENKQKNINVFGTENTTTLNTEENTESISEIKPLPKKTKKVKKQKKENLPNIEDGNYYLKKKEKFVKTKREIFLQKALKNLANNKLNLSSDEDRIFDADKAGYTKDNKVNNNENAEKTIDIQKKIVEATKAKLMEQLREKYYKSIQETLPVISLSEIEKPEALKLNFENNFSKKKKNEIIGKKIVALSKNKEYLLDSKNNLLNGLIKRNCKNIEEDQIKPIITQENFKEKVSKSKIAKNKKGYLNTFYKPYHTAGNIYKRIIAFDKLGKDEYLLFMNCKHYKKCKNNKDINLKK